MINKILVVLFIMSLFVQQIFAQTQIDIDSSIWNLSEATKAEFLGKRCIMGKATLNNIIFENGTIEVDVAVTGTRSYPGIIFRMQSPNEYERFYIRPHLSKAMNNVLQYVAAFNGIDSWQLYNGDGYTASAEIPVNKWFHLKIEVKNVQARVFIDNSSKPVLFIRNLAHGKSKGTLGIMGPNDGSAYFTNFSFKQDEYSDFPVTDKEPEILGMISDWEISQNLKLSNIDIEKTPKEQNLQLKWQKIKSLNNGLVDVSRYYGRQGYTPDVIWAKTTIVSEKDEIKQFAFGYSDIISIFLNGQILFNGNSAYTSRDPNFQGIIGLNDYIYLPLKKGSNELLLAVAESFGGWGFMFQNVNTIFQHESLTKGWEIRFKLKYPESVVYDSKRDVLYVSNTYGDGKDCISKIKMNGEIEKTDWITGILQPTGLCIYNDKLYAIARFALIEIDLNSQKISNRYRFPEPVFPNDITVDSDGNFYITDSGKNTILKFSNGVFENWLASDEIKQPNGIFAEKDKILVGSSGFGAIKAIDIKTKKITTFVSIGRGAIMDGLKSDGKGNYFISDYLGRLFRISASGETTLLLNTTCPKINLADFEYIPSKNVFVIPTLEDNRIMLYHQK